MNKNTIKFSLQVREKDSTNEFTVKRWMYDQKRDSIQKLLTDFLVIAKEHNLKPNVSLEQWMNMVYLPKHYTVKQVVGRDSVNPIEIDHPFFDTINNYVKIEHKERVAYPRQHVPLTQLETAYNRISSAYFAPIEVDYIIVVLYFGFAASLLIFSFRVTSGKSWLISAISLGISGVVTFIIALLMRHLFYFGISEEAGFSYIWLCIIIAIGIWFTYLYTKNQTKKITYVWVNLLLWLLPTLLILIWTIVYSWVSHNTYYNDYDDYYYNMTPDSYYYIRHWMNENLIFLFITNVVVTLLYMFFFTRVIRKWKGIAEA